MKPGTAIRVKRYRGVAFRVIGPPKVWEPDLALVEDPETGETYEEDTGDGEWREDTDSDMVQVHMVGDDHVFTVPVEDCTLLNDEDFCPECGQEGCKAYA